MGEVTFPVKTVQIRMLCDACKKGWMAPTGAILMSNPPKYPHKCEMCEAEETYTKRYPALGYVVEDNW